MANKSLRVLMIDDSELDSLLAIRHLSHGGYAPTLRREEDEVGTRAALSEQKWDVLFCDSSMPGFGASKALELLRKMNLEIPLIVVSGSTGEEAAAAAIRLGAVDWVSKRDLSRLVPVVERHVHGDDVPSASSIHVVPGTAGSALHSFNNALSVVLTYTSVLLNETARNNPIRADLEEIEKAASTAAALALGLFQTPVPLRGRDADEAMPEALALVEAHSRDERPGMKCEVCGGDSLTAIEYRTPDLCAPAFECDRCKAINLDETLAQSAQEREWVRDALARRATAGGALASNGVAPSPSRSATRALHDICDEIGDLLAEAQSTLLSLARTDTESAEGIASTERTMRQIAGLVESLRTAG
jgi:CheY-like chemotaxis protein